MVSNHVKIAVEAEYRIGDNSWKNILESQGLSCSEFDLKATLESVKELESNGFTHLVIDFLSCCTVRPFEVVDILVILPPCIRAVVISYDDYDVKRIEFLKKTYPDLIHIESEAIFQDKFREELEKAFL